MHHLIGWALVTDGKKAQALARQHDFDIFIVVDDTAPNRTGSP
jgi:hypothetical protein